MNFRCAVSADCAANRTINACRYRCVVEDSVIKGETQKYVRLVLRVRNISLLMRPGNASIRL